MFEDITFCIKTIHRPWACHRLVQSLMSEFGNPNIVVVDDGLPEHRFSVHWPQSAERCTVINLEEHDVGVGVGRNTAIDAAQTEYIFLLDDDQVVTSELHLDRMCERFERYGLDILAARQGWGGMPAIMIKQGTSLLKVRGGYHKRDGEVYWCDMVSNAFLARKETIANLRWDEAIKTFEHWEFFYRASVLKQLQVAVAADCFVEHRHVGSSHYNELRRRSRFKKMGLRKHGFSRMVYQSWKEGQSCE